MATRRVTENRSHNGARPSTHKHVQDQHDWSASPGWLATCPLAGRTCPCPMKRRGQIKRQDVTHGFCAKCPPTPLNSRGSWHSSCRCRASGLPQNKACCASNPDATRDVQPHDRGFAQLHNLKTHLYLDYQDWLSQDLPQVRPSKLGTQQHLDKPVPILAIPGGRSMRLNAV
jgi:hypothetical protein